MNNIMYMKVSNITLRNKLSKQRSYFSAIVATVEMSISHMIKWVWNGPLDQAEQYSLLMPLQFKNNQYHVISMTISFISPWNSNDKTDILLNVAKNTITPHPPPPWNRPISCFMLYKRYSIITYFARIATEAVGTGTSEAVHTIDTGPTI